MGKKLTHQIYFEVRKNGISDFKTEPVDFATPQAKEEAGKTLKMLKAKFVNEEYYSITKFITCTEIKEYPVNN